MSARELVEERLLEMEETAVLLDGLDDAIVGLIEYEGKWHVAYSRSKCLIALLGQMDADGPESPDDLYTQAVEWFEYNTLRAIPHMASTGPVPMIIDDEELS